ncbi:Universal stress protein phos34 [Turnera subulata]|uniref:Universal stress protein phos34 n=1 Tax=Turnera subulata TaxID=218843 RepID=A0A9Q0JIH3_9ROSI|nr:Universal stress protein phos34 [Turnera subulata]
MDPKQLQKQQQEQKNPIDPDHPQLPSIKIRNPSSSSTHHPPTHLPSSTPTPTAGARRKIGVAVDLSDESAHAVRWAVNNYLRPGDAVVLLHVSPTSVLFGADWGPLPQTPTTPNDAAASPRRPDANSNEPNANAAQQHNRRQQQREEDFDAFTASKAADLARPLREGQVPYKIHIVKDHDMKERLCLEVERLGLSALIMGSRGFGATKRGNDGRLGSVSDYCVHHCVCPVVVVRYPDDKDGGNGEGEVVVNVPADEDEEEAAAAENRKG